MIIKILGSGCAKCNRLEQLVRDVAGERGVNAEFVHVTDMAQIMAYPIMTTPALVIDEAVKSSGRIPGKDEISAWLSGSGA